MKLRLLDLETKQLGNGEAATDKDGNAKLPVADEARGFSRSEQGTGISSPFAMASGGAALSPRCYGERGERGGSHNQFFSSRNAEFISRAMSFI